MMYTTFNRAEPAFSPLKPGMVLGVFASLLLLLAIAFPLFWSATTTNQRVPGAAVCQCVAFFSYSHVYAHTTSGADSPQCTASCVSYDWHDEPGAAGASASSRKLVMAVAVTLLAVALVLTVAGTAMFFYAHFSHRRLPMQWRGRSLVHVATLLIAFVCLLCALVQFAIGWPEAWRRDLPRGFDVDALDGPWHKFVGQRVDAHASLSWGPGGWIAALVALPFSLILAVMIVVSPTHREEYTAL